MSPVGDPVPFVSALPVTRRDATLNCLTQNTYKRAHTNTDLKSKWESMIQKGSPNPGPGSLLSTDGDEVEVVGVMKDES